MNNKSKHRKKQFGWLALHTLIIVEFLIGCQIIEPDATRSNAVTIEVKPSITREIGGISELDRKVYFAVSDNGANLDGRVQDEAMYDFLVDDLNIRFGRALGPVMAVTYWNKWITEDPNRPGFADIDQLNAKMIRNQKEASIRMRKDFGDNLDVAAHGHQQAYPEFMGVHATEDSLKHGKHPHKLPKNLDAATELAVAVFKNNYNDFTRPSYFEPVNEPHWSFYSDQHLADWHLAVHEAFKEELPEVQVGGLCMSVAYMFDNNYRAWNGFRNFMDNTSGELDFYSFHAYDYLSLKDDEFGGRIQTGLPMEGVLDMIPNYSINQYGTETPIVISEHGGYVTGSQGKSSEETADEIAEKYFPGEGFEWEMKKRSVMNHQSLRSIITNTMTFMDHPHTVKKAVPFILLNSFSWDPKYYATLYVPYNFEDKSRWVPTANMDFYKLFKDLKGRRVYVHIDEADIQANAFVDGKTVYVVLNNLHKEATPIDIAMPKARSYSLRRYGSNPDFTPYLRDVPVKSLNDLTIKGFETLIITAEYAKPIQEKEIVNEITNYADRITVEVAPGTSEVFLLPVAQNKNIDYAQLRVAFRRPPGTDHKVSVLFNGHPVTMPVEDSAYRLESEKDYATTRLVRINPSWIKTENTVAVSFPDGKEGKVGSVTLRTAVPET